MKLEYHMKTAKIEVKRSMGKIAKKDLGGQIKWLNVGQVTDALKTTKD